MTVNDSISWESVERLATHIINKYFSWYSQNDGLKELYQQSYIVFDYAKSNYDHEKGEFTSYFSKCLKVLLLKYINGNNYVYIPINLKADLMRYNKFVDRFYKLNGEKPTRAIICKEMNINSSKLARLEELQYITNYKSIYDHVDNETDLLLCDTLAAEQDIETDLLHSYDLDNICKSLKTFIEEQRKDDKTIIIDFINGVPVSKTAEKLQKSKENIYVKRKNIFRKAKRKQDLKRYYDDYLGCRVSLSEFKRNHTSEQEYYIIKKSMRGLL